MIGRRTPRLWPQRRPLGGYRLRYCSECSRVPAEPGKTLCRRCDERERRAER